MSCNVSFEFTNEKINVAVGRIKANNLIVNKCFTIDMPKNIIVDGKLNDIDILADIIIKAMNEQLINYKNAIFLLNSTLCFSRKIELPYLKSKKETASMINYYLGDMFSKNLDQFKYVFKLVEVFIKDGVKYASYMVIFMPLELHEQYLELSKKLKLNLKMLDLSSSALEYVGLKNLKVNYKHYFPENINIFIRIQEDCICFSAVNKNINDFNRIHYFQHDYTIEMVAEDAAEFFIVKSKTNKSSSTYDDKTARINYFSDAILKYYKYYNSIYKEKEAAKKIYVYGEGCNVDIEKNISSILQIDVEKLESISNINFCNELLERSFCINDYLYCFLSLFSNKSLNFLTEKLNKRRFRFITAMSLIFAISTLIFFVSIKGTSFLYKSNIDRNEMKSMNMFINMEDNIMLNNKIEETRKSIKLMELYKQKAEDLRMFIKEEDYVDSVLLKSIKGAIPDFTTVNNVFIDKSSIQLICKSKDIKDISLLINNLKETGLIDNVYVPNIDVQNGIYSYQVLCNTVVEENEEE